MAARLFRALGYYLIGALMDETAGYSRGASTVEPVPEDVMAEQYPAVVKAGRWFATDQHEKTFWGGLKIFLDGIEREVMDKPNRKA